MTVRLRIALRRVGLFVLAIMAFWLGTAAIAHYALDQFPNFGEAVWSGLQHLLDPGALEDDDDTAERIIGVLQLLVGLVLIVGVLIAVLEEAVSGSLRRLTEGDPSVRDDGHVVILGWNELVPEVIAELAGATGRRRKETAAVLIPERLREQRPAIAAELERRGPGIRVPVLAGDPGPDAFGRLGVRRSRAVVVAAGTESPEHPDAADLDAISACLELGEHLDGAMEPAVYPILHRGRNVDAVLERFPKGWDYLVVDRAIGGIAGVAVSSPRLAEMATAPFSPGGQEGMFFVVAAGELAGREFADLASAHPKGLPVGIVPADGTIVLPPPPGRALDASDRIIVMAERRSDAAARSEPGEPPRAIAATPVAEDERRERPASRLLAVGGATTIAALFEDLGERSHRRFEAGLLTNSAAAIARHAPPNVSVSAIEGAPNEPQDLARALEVSRADVVFVAADPVGDGEAADSRALLTAFHLRRQDRAATPVIVDVLAPVDETIGGPDPALRVLSRATLLARWARMLLEDPDSARVTAELMSGTKTRLEPVRLEPAPETIPFDVAYRTLLEHGSVPIGTISAGRPAELGPPSDGLVRADQLLLAIHRVDGQPAS